MLFSWANSVDEHRQRHPLRLQSCCDGGQDRSCVYVAPRSPQCAILYWASADGSFWWWRVFAVYIRPLTPRSIIGPGCIKFFLIGWNNTLSGAFSNLTSHERLYYALQSARGRSQTHHPFPTDLLCWTVKSEECTKESIFVYLIEKIFLMSLLYLFKIMQSFVR